MGRLLPTAASLRRLLVLPLLALLLAAPASARPVTEAETKSLADTVQRFDAAMKASDFAAVSQTIPPKVMEHIAKSANISVDQLRTVLIQQMTQTMGEVKITSFGMDLSKAVTKELPDGTPFLLIPTETVVDPGTGAMRVTSDTLALLDGGSWYLLRVSDVAQVNILKQVYPGFANETFSPGTTEAVN